MNSPDAQALITIIILLFVFAIILTPIIALWVYIILQNGKRKRIRERILAARSDVIGNKRWFPARYAGQQRFDSFFKILPWEGAGIFVVAIRHCGPKALFQLRDRHNDLRLSRLDQSDLRRSEQKLRRSRAVVRP